MSLNQGMQMMLNFIYMNGGIVSLNLVQHEYFTNVTKTWLIVKEEAFVTTEMFGDIELKSPLEKDLMWLYPLVLVTILNNI